MNIQSTFSFFFLTLIWAITTTHAQSPMSAPVSTPAPPLSAPPAPVPPVSAPPAPSPSSGVANITAILEKARQYGTFIRLLKRTQVADQITTLLNTTNQGITLFAPTDGAFSNLKPGTLNSLTGQEQVNLVHFHLIPSYLTLPQFQTVSNPVSTQAGNDYIRFPMNITASGPSVNITTGMVNTTVDDTIYTDGQLAVYRVNKVLLSVGVFKPAVPPPAPAPSSKKKAKSSSSSSSSSSAAPVTSQDVSVVASDVNGKKNMRMMRVGAALLALLISSIF